jgi:hypothetical protein
MDRAHRVLIVLAVICGLWVGISNIVRPIPAENDYAVCLFLADKEQDLSKLLDAKRECWAQYDRNPYYWTQWWLRLLRSFLGFGVAVLAIYGFGGIIFWIGHWTWTGKWRTSSK